ncbi:MFS transporter [Acidithiobacillus sp. CV18-2]|uniref:MFS transporter n=1 Tax=Igneacidithiobacillus copahuensis TaxID=2724909 RepID=A0AAE2YSA0_9PROT|nr:MFS transporter [Igneacidithiobacillus copahuensis]MBU2753826.1 MFS transporter [Acidithiobacillus sp. CV18-3]MBU2756588.1 MFS transporter [Acidithiobacillus sp. BN09-2]MBU2777460.1 MFS transporter [Acidithiobacillus sp. CV18-2]MBU2796178.1 MFS transporter [Acidithiobacillus sp. VAN18-2]MBU2799877.1 MFS transporter [Acidithiobacillus sp. VAN18-4]UTV82152.1 MFS transporter [Acidithiobacillus sp. YTS05]
MSSIIRQESAVRRQPQGGTRFDILGAISVSHFLNDSIQSLMLAVYPLFRSNFHLSFAQIGLITLAYQLTASIIQPLVGRYTDRHPLPWSLPLGMVSTFAGLLLLSIAPNYLVLLLAAALVGLGSSVFHPESSRVARMASGGRFGLAQSIFQVGGNVGTAAGPLLAAFLVMPNGQESLSWFSLFALAAIVILTFVGRWYQQQHRQPKKAQQAAGVPLPKALVRRSMVILVALMFSKFIYLTSISSYLIFYLMHRFAIPVREAQLHLFIFLAAVAAGTLLGGPIGDRVGRKRVIWVSLLGIAPFTLALPYVGLTLSALLTVVIGFLLASAFPAIVVYAQELVPGKVGTISGLFFGLAFGLGGIGAAVLGQLADIWGIDTVYQICSFLPLLGILAAFLPHRPEA